MLLLHSAILYYLIAVCHLVSWLGGLLTTVRAKMASSRGMVPFDVFTFTSPVWIPIAETNTKTTLSRQRGLIAQTSSKEAPL